MTTVTYEVVQYASGWASRANGIYSENFPSHDAARSAAERVATAQRRSGDDEAISYEDRKGEWHDELFDSSERLATKVEG